MFSLWIESCDGFRIFDNGNGLFIHKSINNSGQQLPMTSTSINENQPIIQNVVVNKINKDNDETYIDPLLNDIELLSNILGEVIKRENDEVYSLYERFRGHALARANGDSEALQRMVNCSADISESNALGVIRAFTQTLNLINAAEVHHRMRRLRKEDMEMNRMSPLPMREDSVAGTMERLLAENTGESDQHKKKQIFNKLINQHVDIVLTAHPTEVNRRTLLRKHRSISEMLASLDRKDLTSFERQQVQDSLKREIASIWGTDEIRRQKPSPQQEARGGLAILESVLWDAVPSYLRKLNSQCVLSLNQPLPLNFVPIRFSSWMGGDRDGNPNVTPQVTYEVAVTQRMQVAKLLMNDIVSLYKDLAICRGFSEDMLSLAKSVKYSFDKRELYRRVLGHLKERLLATVAWCENELMKAGAEFPTSLHVFLSSEISVNTKGDINNLNNKNKANDHNDVNTEPNEFDELMGSPGMPLFDAKVIQKILEIMHVSLTSSGYADVADGLLIDIIRRVATFGLTLAPLDIRQESTRHMMVLDAVTRYLGIGSYAAWDEMTKINWLQSELANKRPLFLVNDMNSLGFDEQVLDALSTIQVASSLGPGSLGAYVISQAKSASDVLAVMLLQKQFGMTITNNKLMRVVPLFETLTDLNNAPSVIDTLFSLPNYLGTVKAKQEIMVGYSDSAKDAGRLAASWAQYESQEKMSKVASKYGVQLTFFHGKGGTVGRGGNPALYRAVLAHPPNTINGRFRVTEQGEMITQNFGSTGIAERTFDIYTAAVLAEQFTTHVDPKPQYRNQMARLSEISCDEYRSLLVEERFIQYFRQATPEVELGYLNIGSRPTKRNPKGGIESLRAIPWTFAWTQTRLHLPAWLGVGEALNPSITTPESEKAALELQEMYRDWPFFREMIDLIAMTLSKTDYDISLNYESQLIDKQQNDEKTMSLLLLGEEIRKKLLQTTKSILHVTQSDDLSCGFLLLQRSMKVRYPYVDPLNALQAEMMKRLRLKKSLAVTNNNDTTLLEDSLIVAINGIASGMRNSG
eukprot:gene4144-5898_t